MPEALAEQTNFHSPEKSDTQADQSNKPGQEFDEGRLSKVEVARLREGKVTIQQLAAERLQLKAAAEAELNRLVTTTREHENLIDLKEYKNLKQELEETDSPDQTEEILERIMDIPKKKEEQKLKEKEESKELDPDNPKLLELQKQFERICDENKHCIGLRQVPGFKSWFAQERRENPTVKHLKDLIQKLEGKEVSDRDGLAPRREEYSKLKRLFQRYGISSPLQSEWIKQEGLSERQEFRENAEALEEHFRRVRDTGFYSQEMIRQTMREMLLAQNPTEQTQILNRAKAVSREEAQAFTYLDSKMTIAGVTIRKMSEASKRKYLEYYKGLNLNEREQAVSSWQKLVENEAKLAEDLAEIYEDDPEALKLALASFEELDYVAKEQALKEHEKLVAQKERKEEVQRTLIITAANTKIDAAANKKIIAPGGEDSTQGRYRTFFGTPENFKNPKTKETDDLEELKKAYDILVSPAPQSKYKNLAAYEVRRTKFQKDLQKLREVNSALTPEDIQEWQDRYDYESWTGRAKIANEELPKEIAKQQREQRKKRILEIKAGLSKEGLEQGQTPELESVVKAAAELLNNDQGAEAMKILLEYNAADPDNPKILFWIKTVADYMEKFGSGKKKEDTVEREVAAEVENLAQGDRNIRDSFEEAQIKTLNLEGARMSERRHDNKISGRDRAEKESMDRTDADSLEADLTSHAYSEIGEEYILDEEGTGEKIEEVYFDETGLIEEDFRRLKQKTYHKQSKLADKQGFSHINLTDKSGREVSAREGEALHEEELDRLEEDIAHKALDKVEARSADLAESGQIFDINTHVAAHRKAREFIDKKRNEKLRQAA